MPFIREVPNYRFDEKCFWIEAKTRRESSWAILKLWHPIAIQEDRSGYHTARGGVMTAPYAIKTPDGRLFRLEGMTKDIAYWRQSLIQFCNREERVWGEFKDGRVVFSDGCTFTLAELEFEFPAKREEK